MFLDENEIKIAKLEDAESIAKLYLEATDAMHAIGITQWNYDYPLISDVIKDIENGALYKIVLEGEIAAVIALNQVQDEQYKAVNWQGKEQTALIIHRLAVRPKFQRRGLAKTLCLFAEQFALKNGLDSIRLDTYSENVSSINLYRKLDYVQYDNEMFFNGNIPPFYPFEKVLKKA